MTKQTTKSSPTTPTTTKRVPAAKKLVAPSTKAASLSKPTAGGAASKISETETVIKRILPYLFRRGYTLDDMSFEEAAPSNKRYTAGYVDITVSGDTRTSRFLIEAKRLAKNLTDKDRDQAIDYAKALGILFVVVTNGTEVRVFNTDSGLPMLWDDRKADKIPTKAQLKNVINKLKANPSQTKIALSDSSLPFKPGLPLRQLNALFQKCHNIIRKIEKDEEHAFSDFSKLLFLKLLEEKADNEPEFKLPYSFQFHKLAENQDTNADQVKVAVMSMLDSVQANTPYGDVLSAPMYMTKDKTFYSLVKELSRVCFSDSSLDSKGAAFEYFVRATLKGKSLGQYFTPRPVVQMMSALVGREKLLNELLAHGGDEDTLKVYDPACGTGGFLVYLLEQSLRQLDDRVQSKMLSPGTAKKLVARLKKETFFGSDANRGVAGAAKMNMIIAGDGHSNIQPEDSLLLTAKNWSTATPDCNFIFSNPPFGTSESSTLSSADREQFDIKTSKGQLLFLQKMVKATKPGGEICTVIDEGVLNTELAKDVRAWLLKQCKLKAVVKLPEETFKPNKINVKSSVLLLEKLEEPDENSDQNYDVVFVDVKSLGYDGSGDAIRGFDLGRLLDEAETLWLQSKKGRTVVGYAWEGFDVSVDELRKDAATRFDLKYWEPTLRKQIQAIIANGGKTIKELKLIPTRRGKSPDADAYVDRADGHALVIKSGSSMSKFGELIAEGDWIEKSNYDELEEKAKASGSNLNLVAKGDVLVSSTGDGSLGKTCVYSVDHPAIADGHVAIVRPDIHQIDPEYLADFLRTGVGAQQIERLFTGSTGQIELSPEMLDCVVVDLLANVRAQRAVSKALRSAEAQYRSALASAEKNLTAAQDKFSGKTP